MTTSIAHAVDCPTPSAGEILPLHGASVHFIDGASRRSMGGMSLVASLYAAFQESDTVILVEWATSNADVEEIGTANAWRDISRVARDMDGSIVYVHINQRAARRMPGKAGVPLGVTLRAWERSPPRDLAELSSVLCAHAPPHKFEHRLLDDHVGEAGFHWHEHVGLEKTSIATVVAHFDPNHSIPARARIAWIERLTVAGLIIFLFVGVFAVSRRRKQRAFDWLQTSRGATCERCGCDVLPGETICRVCSKTQPEPIDELLAALVTRRATVAEALKSATWIDVSDVAKFFHELAGTLEDRRLEAYQTAAAELEVLVVEIKALVEQIPGPDDQFIAPLMNRLERFTLPERRTLDRWREQSIELYVCLDVVVMELQLRALMRART